MISCYVSWLWSLCSFDRQADIFLCSFMVAPMILKRSVASVPIGNSSVPGLLPMTEEIPSG